jgi:hypothetical protein
MVQLTGRQARMAIDCFFTGHFQNFFGGVQT